MAGQPFKGPAADKLRRWRGAGGPGLRGALRGEEETPPPTLGFHPRPGGASPTYLPSLFFVHDLIGAPDTSTTSGRLKFAAEAARRGLGGGGGVKVRLQPPSPLPTPPAPLPRAVLRVRGRGRHGWSKVAVRLQDPAPASCGPVEMQRAA